MKSLTKLLSSYERKKAWFEKTLAKISSLSEAARATAEYDALMGHFLELGTDECKFDHAYSNRDIIKDLLEKLSK